MSERFLVFDQILFSVTYSRSCGLARVIQLETEQEYLLLMQNLSRVLLAGFYAVQLSRIKYTDDIYGWSKDKMGR